LLLVVVNFAYLVPILTDQTIPYEEWRARIWLRSWF
jgi:dolichyl-phosphate-mannose-protein mannosyltransferase